MNKNRVTQYQIVNETRHFAKSIIKYHTIANLAEVVYYYILFNINLSFESQILIKVIYNDVFVHYNQVLR